MAETPRVPNQGCWGAWRCAQWATFVQLLPAATAHFLETQQIFSFRRYRPLVGEHSIYIYSKIMQLYLQNVHGLAGILVPASFCRTVSILCFWPGCGGAVRTQWTTGPAPIKTPCQTKWRCRLPRHPKYVYTPPPGQISTHTAAPHTMTTLHMQPETKKRKRKMNVNCRFHIYHDMTVIAERSL